MPSRQYTQDLDAAVRNYAQALKRLQSISGNENAIIVAAASLRVLLKEPTIIWVGQVMYRVDNDDKLTIKDERLV